MTQKSPPSKKSWSWRSQAFRGLVYQVVALGLIGWRIGRHRPA